jgi:hypothetical protein
MATLFELLFNYRIERTRLGHVPFVHEILPIEEMTSTTSADND